MKPNIKLPYILFYPTAQLIFTTFAFNMNDVTSINILLADDDKDDCLFFSDALSELPMTASLSTVNDGEQLMQYLETVSANLPQALFLDLNIPRKNGFECLIEIKKHALFKKIPVIMYSTSYDEEISNQLYNSGAHYYICKPADYGELKKVIHRALLLVKENDPSKENFIVNKLNPAL